MIISSVITILLGLIFVYIDMRKNSVTINGQSYLPNKPRLLNVLGNGLGVVGVYKLLDYFLLQF